MKIIVYNLIQKINIGTFDEPIWEEIKGAAVTMGYSEANLAIAQSEAWQGEVTIEDDGQPDPTETPTQLDVIEAQVTYMAMITGTLLEV